MKHGSLFSGIGGFDLASEWMGWENVFHCEWNEFGKKVLKHYWPNAESFDDITKTDFTKYANKIDILTGGFPCQPYSMAGKRKGKEDERHLWPEMLRAIREIAPRYVVGENVLGLVNWDGGLVFDEVHAELESAGYEVQAVVIPAAAVNAPHGRDRVWFVAKNTMHSGCAHGEFKQERTAIWEQRNTCSRGSDWVCVSQGTAANTNSRRLGRSTEIGWNGINVERESKFGNATDTESICIQRQCNGQGKGEFRRSNWCWFPTQSPICGGDDGLPTELDGITFPKWRNESIKGYGNAIVPQVAYQIFKAIQEID